MTAAFYRTDDLRIKWTKVVLPPIFLEEELPAAEQVSSTIRHARNQICDILAGKDHRLLVVAGPPAACLGPLLSGGIQECHFRGRAGRHSGCAIGCPAAHLSRPHQDGTIGDLC